MFLRGGLARLSMLLTSALTKYLRSSLRDALLNSGDNFVSRYFARSNSKLRTRPSLNHSVPARLTPWKKSS